MEIFSFSSLVIDIDQIVSLKVYKPALTSLPGTLKALWTIFNQQTSGQASVATVLQSLLQHISAYAVSKPWLFGGKLVIAILTNDARVQMASMGALLWHYGA